MHAQRTYIQNNYEIHIEYIAFYQNFEAQTDRYLMFSFLLIIIASFAHLFLKVKLEIGVKTLRAIEFHPIRSQIG